MFSREATHIYETEAKVGFGLLGDQSCSSANIGMIVGEQTFVNQRNGTIIVMQQNGVNSFWASTEVLLSWQWLRSSTSSW